MAHRTVFSLLLCALLAIAVAAPACVWIKGTKYSGASVTTGGVSTGALLRRFMEEDLHAKGLRMERELRGSTNFNDRSDCAVAWMYLGDSAEAVKRLQALENEKPGEYFIAANLGTALELSGRDEEALHWIKEGISRDPDSHEGTEWLHVKILEAKLAHQRDTNYFNNHTVLNFRPEQLGGEVTIDGTNLSLSEISLAMQYQFRERLAFVKAPDPTVAALLFDYAAVEARTKTLESAKGILLLAGEFGYPAEKIQPLVALYDRRIIWRKRRDVAFWTLLVVAGIAALVVCYRKGIFVLSRRDLERTT
jgi:tetratricopeptide (TPR) repeat protein